MFYLETSRDANQLSYKVLDDTKINSQELKIYNYVAKSPITQLKLLDFPNRDVRVQISIIIELYIVSEFIHTNMNQR